MIAAEVVAVDSVHVTIICPHCGKFHRHGIRFVEGRYRSIHEHRAGPELTAIFGRAI